MIQYTIVPNILEHISHFQDVSEKLGHCSDQLCVRLAIGPLVSLMCRSLYDNIKSAHYWSSYIKLSDLARFQLNWWLENLENLNGFPICKEPTIVKFEFSVAGDASNREFFVYR
jgi:hypothetical protein